jgi:hypothetical protein
LWQYAVAKMAPAGGAWTASRAMRLMNAAARYAGSAGDLRNTSRSSKKPFRFAARKQLESKSP